MKTVEEYAADITAMTECGVHRPIAVLALIQSALKSEDESDQLAAGKRILAADCLIGRVSPDHG